MNNLYLYLVLLVGFWFCTAVEAEANEVPSTKPIIYSVQKGDCLYNIARHYGLSTRELYKLNKHQIKNPNLIRIGQKLIIGYETITNNQPAIVDSTANANMLALPSAEELSSFVTTLSFEIPLDKLFVIHNNPMIDTIATIIEDFEEAIERENITISSPVRLSLADKLRALGIKCNTPYIKPYSLKAIERNIRLSLKSNKLIYNNDKSFVFNEDSTALYIKRSDYKQLLWACYGLGYQLYDCQDPRLVIMAEEMGIKFNTREQYFSYEEITASMIDSVGRKKIVYADVDEGEVRFYFSGKRIWLDCSAFAYFLSNLYGVEPVGQTTANIFTAKNSRRLFKSIDDLKPGDYVGRAGRVRGHVQVYLGNGMFAHSSGELPLFISKDAVQRKGRLYACTPSTNYELEQIQNAGKGNIEDHNFAAVSRSDIYSRYLKVNTNQ
ncbi:MAG: LysM peptidoglycan-binding domain-containing protein [bacterium]